MKRKYFFECARGFFILKCGVKGVRCPFHNEEIGKLPSLKQFLKGHRAGSATVKVAFNLVEAVEGYGRSKEFGFLPTISVPGPSFALRPSPLDSAREFESTDTN